VEDIEHTDEDNEELTRQLFQRKDNNTNSKDIIMTSANDEWEDHDGSQRGEVDDNTSEDGQSDKYDDFKLMSEGSAPSPTRSENGEMSKEDNITIMSHGEKMKEIEWLVGVVQGMRKKGEEDVEMTEDDKTEDKVVKAFEKVSGAQLTIEDKKTIKQKLQGERKRKRNSGDEGSKETMEAMGPGG
jgi:hypothetical protein